MDEISLKDLEFVSGGQSAPQPGCQCGGGGGNRNGTGPGTGGGNHQGGAGGLLLKGAVGGAGNGLG